MLFSIFSVFTNIDNNEEEIWNYLYDLVEVFKYPKKPKKGEIIIEKEVSKESSSSTDLLKKN